MSTCEAIMSKLDSLESKIDGGLQAISTLTELVVDYNTENNDIRDGQLQAISTLTDIVVEVYTNLANNHLILSDDLYNISTGIKNLGILGKANNESLKGLAMSNGSLPTLVLQQISNSESILISLNESILRG